MVYSLFNQIMKVNDFTEKLHVISILFEWIQNTNWMFENVIERPMIQAHWNIQQNQESGGNQVAFTSQ